MISKIKKLYKKTKKNYIKKIILSSFFFFLLKGIIWLIILSLPLIGYFI
jgi:hypothetical protein